MTAGPKTRINSLRAQADIEPNRVSDDRRGDWWRANEIVIRRLTRRTATRQRSRNKTFSAQLTSDYDKRILTLIFPFVPSRQSPCAVH
jgi:hypothetical protein